MHRQQKGCDDTKFEDPQIVHQISSLPSGGLTESKKSVFKTKIPQTVMPLKFYYSFLTLFILNATLSSECDQILDMCGTVVVSGNMTLMVLTGVYFSLERYLFDMKFIQKKAMIIVFILTIVFWTVSERQNIKTWDSNQTENQSKSNTLFIILLIALFKKYSEISYKILNSTSFLLALFYFFFSLTITRFQDPLPLLVHTICILIAIFLLNFKHENPNIYTIQIDPQHLQFSISQQNLQDQSDLDHIILNCHFIQDTLRHIGSSITNKQTQKKIFNSLAGLQKVKEQIAKGTIKMKNLVPSSILDSQDRAFLHQNFTQLSIFSLDPQNQRNQIRENSFISIIQKPEDLTIDWSNSSLENLIKRIGYNWNFDIFFIAKQYSRPLTMIASFSFTKWKLNDQFNLDPDMVSKYFSALESSYIDNPYHNAYHAADVLNSTIYFILHSKIMQEISLLESLSVFIASLAHDVGHPGKNNRFLVMSQDQLAIRYNDISVLQNMHAAKTFSLFQEKELNFLQNLSEQEFSKVRKIVISMILATDMSKHFSALNVMKVRISTNSLNYQKQEDLIFILEFALKCADIGHAAKSLQIHLNWTERISEEFFAQGDIQKELKLPVSAFCDRETTSIDKSQHGFLKNVCLPLYQVWAKFLGCEEIEKECVEQLRANIGHWEFQCFKKGKTIQSLKQKDTLLVVEKRKRNFSLISQQGCGNLTKRC